MTKEMLEQMSNHELNEYRSGLNFVLSNAVKDDPAEWMELSSSPIERMLSKAHGLPLSEIRACFDRWEMVVQEFIRRRKIVLEQAELKASGSSPN